ncbi:hypothetical protein [Marinobacter segnicrescens]|uniref:hypothetical protein n=1 Tax=Marinobacter segnicrescens TaxID=430453 RepID=UPI003A8DEFA2
MPKTTTAPIIKFTSLYRVLDICDVIREGAFSKSWDGEYERVVSGNSTVSIPKNGGSQILLKKIPLKSKDSIPREIANILPHQESVYLVTSNRYSIHYVGITSKGIAGVFSGGGRFSHHVRKILASTVNKGTNHTSGWISHARARYIDIIKSVDGQRQPTDEDLLGDIFIAFGVSDTDWSSKEHEGVVEEYFRDRISMLSGRPSIRLNSAKMSRKHAEIYEPENIKSALYNNIKF